MDAVLTTTAPCGDPVISSITVEDSLTGVQRQCTICGHVYSPPTTG